MNFVTFFVICIWIQMIRAVSRVAVIGGGIGGTSAAFFLKQKMSRNVEIDLIDDGGALGGRLATVHVPEVDREYETGGSIIHSSNKLMLKFMDICGLKKKFHPFSPITIHKDGEPVFQGWEYSWLDTVRMGWRYGFKLSYKLARFVDKLVNKFSRKMLESMELNDEMDLTKVTLAEKLDSLDIDQLLINELATLATLGNYGQMPDSLHAFVGFVAMAGTGGSLFSVLGGNKQVAACNMRNSGARGYNGTATRVSRKNGAFTVKVKFDNFFKPAVKDYDAVIIAAPLTSDLGSLELPEDVNQDFPGRYHETVTTIVQGKLVPSALGFKENSSFTTSNIFLDPSSNMIALNKAVPVDYNPDEDDDVLPSVFGMHSRKEFSPSELRKMFSNVKFTHSKSWLAYPHYTTQDDFTSYELSPGLYYLNRIEWAASAMEMSAISAKNIANMAASYLDQKENIKIYEQRNRIKDEL